MSAAPEADKRKDVLARALVELRDLRARVSRAERAQREPIAVIGIGCRFPGGATSPRKLWELLRQGVDATREVPPERWNVDDYYDPDPSAPGKMYTRRGGFIDDVDRFDGRFFGCTRRELQNIDPQHRLLLMTCWEALEHAALPPDALSGSRTSVFFGLSSSDYAQMLAQATPLEKLDGYFGLGTAANFAPGRLSFFLGLQGPSVAVDTACSSSLVAVHLACQSLRAGEVDFAIAGGVSLMLSPIPHVVLSKARVLAPDGRCKTFDAAADGYGRGEGCGVVVLRRLSDAESAGDRVLAVIRGSAVNQDGPSSGLTVPNAAAQRAVISEAVAAAALKPRDICYVEAHGTGTPLGDPIEVRAVAAALGADRTAENPVLLGTVKTNIGHLEAAAGIAGLIKVVLALQHGEMPAHLGFSRPNPAIEWDRLPVKVVTEPTPFPGPGPHFAGVSSFGASGTNAHLVLESPPPQAPHAPGADVQASHLLVVSARSERALAELAQRYAGALGADAELDLDDFACTAATGRRHFPHRLAIVASSREAALTALGASAVGATAPGTVRGHLERPDPPRVVFLCTGQGSQHAGMGRELYATQPAFRDALDRCGELLRPVLDRALLSVLYPPADDRDAWLDETQYTQPALFAFEYAVASLWQSWGVEPAAVLGHSLGEYVAACLAGVLSLEDSLTLVARRAALCQQTSRDAAMAAVFAPPARLAEAIERRAGELAISALNGPTETVISGARAAVAAALEELAAGGVRGRLLRVSHAFHSPLMDPILDEVEREAGKARLQPPRIDLVANVTGGLVRDEIAAPAYFRRQLREPVRFAEGVEALCRHGYDLFVEIGPNPVLCAMGRRCNASATAAWLPSLRQAEPCLSQLNKTLAELYVRGVPVRWQGIHAHQGRRKVSVPTYPFQEERHWIPNPPPDSRHGATIVMPAPGLDRGRVAGIQRGIGAGETTPACADTPLIAPLAAPQTARADAVSRGPLFPGRQLHSPALAAEVFESELSAGSLSVLRDHRVYGQTLVSGVVHLALVALAVREVDPAFEMRSEVEGVEFLAPLVLPEDAPVTVQTIVMPRTETGEHAFRLVSLRGDHGFIEHTRGRVRRLAAAAAAPPPVDLAAARTRCSTELDGDTFYERFWRPGEHELGPSFRTIARIWRRDGECLASLRHPPQTREEAAQAGVDPRFLLGVCIGEVYGQALMPAVADFERVVEAMDETFLGQGMAAIRDFTGAAHEARYCHALITQLGGDEVRGDVCLLDETGAVLAAVGGLVARRIKRSTLRRLVDSAVCAKPARPKGCRSALVGADPAEARLRALRYVRAQVGHVAGVTGDDIETADSLRSLGLDSLMAVELQQALREDLALTVPLDNLLGTATAGTLAEQLASALQPSDPTGTDAADRELAAYSTEGRDHRHAGGIPALAVANSLVMRQRLAPSDPAAAAEPAVVGSRWLRPLQAVAKPRLRLFCLPHAGAGPAAFLPWRNGLPAAVDAHIVHLPGRAERTVEPPVQRLSRLVELLYPAIEPYLDVPFAFFGASLGALIAFELSRALRRRQGPTPQHLFVAGCPAPNLPTPFVREGQAIREAMQGRDASAGRALVKLGLMPDALLDPDVFRLFLPALHGDFELVLTYEYQAEAPLGFPISVFGGKDDEAVSRELLLPWSRQTAADFALRALPGPHLFYRTHAAEVLAALAPMLA